MRAPVVWTLVAGLMTVTFGTFALIIGWREDGLPQLLIPIVALGLILVGWSIREVRREKPGLPIPVDGPPKPPGRWFLYALGAIVVLQFAWITYWRLSRR